MTSKKTAHPKTPDQPQPAPNAPAMATLDLIDQIPFHLRNDLMQSIYLVAHNKIDEACEQLDALISQLPEVSMLLLLRSTLRLQINDAAGTRADLRSAVEADKQNALLFERFALMQIDGENYRTAEEIFDQSIAVGCAGMVTFIGRCKARLNLSDLDGAMADIETALAYDLAGFDGSASEFKLRQMEAYMHRAQIKIKRADLPGALEDMDTAIECRGEPAAFEQRALLKVDMGDRAGAIADLDRTLEAEPDHVADRLLRSQLRRELGDIDGAWDDCRHCEQIAPNLPEVVANKKTLLAQPQRH